MSTQTQIFQYFTALLVSPSPISFLDKLCPSLHTGTAAGFSRHQRYTLASSVQAHTVQEAKRLGKYNESGVVVPAGDIKFKSRKVRLPSCRSVTALKCSASHDRRGRVALAVDLKSSRLLLVR